MTSALRSVIVVTLAVVATLLALPGTASAAPPTVGYDASYPQCGSTLRSHTTCPSCGYYKGRQVLSVGA